MTARVVTYSPFMKVIKVNHEVLKWFLSEVPGGLLEDVEVLL